MAFKDLFKTQAERKAYAKGRRDQYNKEHPKYKYAIETHTHVFNEDGSYYRKPYGSVLPGDKFKTKKEAEKALKEARQSEKFRMDRVLKAVYKKKVNVYDSHDCQYNSYGIVKINERKK